MERQRIAVFGAGNMGTALIRGMLTAHWAKPQNLMATNPRKERCEALAKELGIRATTDNKEAAAWCSTLVLAVKPQKFHDVLQEIAPSVTKDKLVISIAAGVGTRTIEGYLPAGTPVIRSMPNLGVTVQLGATALCRSEHARREDLAVAEAIFQSVGLSVEVDEQLMDAVTGLSGTGPMYVFQVIEGLSDAGVKMGLSRSVSNQLVVQTVLGAAKLVQVTGQHPGLLKDQVTSPGGTAIAALHKLEAGGLKALLMDAVETATKRSAELGSRVGGER
ncbi:MAG TPA: pyrroline-5-carboxylate reductase [Candidatus Thermoplasmatota archaeon]|jgi:pyrroline-5-carboxylate reductase|nr:pyrroline-5-carboxylate reductase [Candidatus Thermoplasmatota archaeon]